MVFGKAKAAERCQEHHLRTGITLSVQPCYFLGHGGGSNGCGFTFRELSNETRPLALEDRLRLGCLFPSFTGSASGESGRSSQDSEGDCGHETTSGNLKTGHGFAFDSFRFSRNHRRQLPEWTVHLPSKQVPGRGIRSFQPSLGMPGYR